MSNKVFKVIFSDKEELSDLDLVFPYFGDGINYDPDGEDRNKVLDDFDTYPAEINQVLDILTKFKDSGNTHVYIWNHEDHHGYEFIGASFEDITNTSECDDREQKLIDLEKENALKLIAQIKAKYGV